MGMANNQELPIKAVAKEPWTFRRLLPFSGAVSAITKTFTSPIEVIFGFMIAVTGISELIGNRPSWTWYVLVLLVLIVLVSTPYVTSFINDRFKNDG